MKPGIPWSVKGIEPEVREAAKHAARRAGMTLGEWLNTVILDQNDQVEGPQQASETSPAQEYFSREPERPQPRREEPQRRSDSHYGHEPQRRVENTIRLEDIAQQLSQLAQRERESATIMPYEPPRGRSDDREVLDRILGRIDNNERQAVEAFTAVNERLSVLGRQIAMAAKPQVIEKPEDVPGYPALEAAIRNVVEHIEVSEKRTRDSLKAMQERLGDMAERATQPTNPDDLVRSAPAFSSLEARIAEMSARMQRSEHHLQAGIPDIVRTELNQLADRIEAVKASAETLANEAQSSAVGVARDELRDIETRILGVLKEAQSMIGGQQSVTSDVQRLRGEISGLNKRIDEVKSATATERDVHALRVAVEQLSTRVAQGPDMRPLADMDRRLGDLTRKLDQNNAAARNLPQFGELERRIAELDHRLGEAMRLQGDHQAVEALEQHIAAVNERVGRTEEQLGHLETMEQAIHQLYQSLEQNRAQVSQTAEEAANRAVERVLAAQSSAGPSPELRAMEEGLRAVRESAANAEQRNQETLEAVHETLEQIVNKLTELETASAGHQLAANMAQQAASIAPAPASAQTAASPGFIDIQQQPATATGHFYDPTGAFDQQVFDTQPQDTPEKAYEPPQPGYADELQAHATAGEASPLPQMPDFGPPADVAPQQAPDFGASAAAAVGSDDFIAAARRAAQAAASRPGSPAPELKAGAKPAAAPSAKKGFSLPFLKSKEQYKPVTYVNGQPVVEAPEASANDNKRKKLVLAGIVLLAAVSAFAFNMLAKPKAMKQTTTIEAPVSVSPATAAKPPKAGLPDADTLGTQSQNTFTGAPADLMATGSLPAKKTDATLSSIVAEPGAARAEMPPPEAGPLALREAAARGDAKAQFIIASRYLDGQSVAQDLPKAAYWYQQAASRGLAPAQYRLATLFERGKGVPQDAATAMLWYERAAEGGNLKAMHNAAVIAAGNQAGTPNYDKAFRWFLAAAEQGLHDSQFNLAVLFERGLGTRIDKAEAFFWYTLAAKQGDTDAAKRAETLSKVLSGAEAASVSARVAGWTPIPSPDEANIVAVTDPVWNEAPPAAAAAPGIMDSNAAAPVVASAQEPAPTASPVAQAQELLTRLGYNVGTADGKMGGRTANAIRLFQLQSGLKVTGEVTPELIDVMRERAG
jgi:localization factor PodJL